MNITDILGKVINDDCVNVMKQLPDKCVDLTLSDFPYARNVAYENYADTRENLKRLVEVAMPEILRISKRVLITCGTNNDDLFPRPDWKLAWVVPAGASYVEWGFSCWQPILAYGKDPYLAAGRGARPDTLVMHALARKNEHPCPKPLSVWRWFLDRGSIKTTDIIFDPFMGSGTTGIVAKESGRPWAGVELSPVYAKIAEKEIASARMMLTGVAETVVAQPAQVALAF